MTTLTKPRKTHSSESQKTTIQDNRGAKSRLTLSEKAEIATFYQKIKPTLKDLPLD